MLYVDNSKYRVLGYNNSNRSNNNNNNNNNNSNNNNNNNSKMNSLFVFSLNVVIGSIYVCSVGWLQIF
jgi:hypothetical protein